MKVKAKSFEAWKVIMITLVFLSYCVGMMPGEKAQATDWNLIPPRTS